MAEIKAPKPIFSDGWYTSPPRAEELRREIRNLYELIRNLAAHVYGDADPADLDGEGNSLLERVQNLESP